MSAVEHRHLRSAVEFAVLIAAEGQKRRPPLRFPKELKPFLGQRRLPTTALGRVRRIVESDDEFRRAISAGAVPELVDEVGRLWLAGERDWEARAGAIIDQRAEQSESQDLQRDLNRADKRRVAAEQAAARIQAEVLVRDQAIAAHLSELDELRADVTKLAEELTEVRTELIDTRNELRHARDREAAAVRRAERAGAQRAPDAADPDRRPAPSRGPAAEASIDEATSVRAAAEARARLDEAVEASRAFAAEMERLLANADDADDADVAHDDDPNGRHRQSSVHRNDADATASGKRTRSPVALPGGVISTSAQAAEHLVRSDALILVDGYNVSKLAWPDRSLADQRDALIGRAENLARRHGAEVMVVFDGDSVVGAHADRRRMVRVVYSPSGVTADDVIRDAVAGLAIDRSVVVVTNDREIVDDVRRLGANVVPSNAFIATL